MKSIAELIKGLEVEKITGDENDLISKVECDSRQVEEGDLFVCVVGFTCDAHKFIPDVLKKGAKALLVQNEIEAPEGVTVIKVKDTRRALSAVAANFFDQPTTKLTLTGVTGTNGKTTTTNLIESIMRESGFVTGLVGTISNKIAGEVLPTERTTPESFEVQKLMQRMVNSGVQHTVMEVSSHALDLFRVADCNYEVAVFTNLTQDHLDYHETMENYFQAKAILFRMARFGVINIDDEYGKRLHEMTAAPHYTYGVDNEADIKAYDIQVTLQGLKFQVKTPKGEMALQLHLTGMFNVYNTLAAVGAGLALKADLATIKKALEKVGGVDGRFQLVENGKHDFAVVVDYAHTPDGLENILQTARSFVKGKIITVFGCGGDRDRTKRPIMGKIGTDYSDYAVLTSDNPRTEDPIRILNDVEEGAKQGKCAYSIEVDRKKAIEMAINMAKKDDLVIIAGKGHETYQIFADKTIHFDDREVAIEALAKIDH